MKFINKNIYFYSIFFLILSLLIILFFCSFYGILYSHKFFIIYLEFVFINLLYIYNNIKLQIIIIYILTLTAIKTAIGLALFILYYKMFTSIKIYYLYILKFMIQKENKIIFDNSSGQILKYILVRNSSKIVFVDFIVKRLFNNNYK